MRERGSTEIEIVEEYAIYRGKVRAFKKLVQELTDIVKATEPEILGYLWYFNSDESSCYLVQRFTNSASALTHIANAEITPLLPKLHETSRITRFEIFGNMSPRLEKILAKYEPGKFRYWIGFSS
jgi:quinol monooxygenase YgiN